MSMNETQRLNIGKKYSLIGIGANLLLFLLKLTVSLISGSLSAITDALNNLTDASASVVSLVGFRFSEKEADNEHPYGHARAEYLSAMVVAMITLFIGFELVKSSVSEILFPTRLTLSPTVFFILLLTIIIKIIMAVTNFRAGKRINSTALLAAAADSRNDALVTTAVLTGYATTYVTDIPIDGYMSLFVAIFICAGGILLTKSTLSPLLGEAPDKELVEYIHAKILSYPSVLGAHDLILHDYGPRKRFSSVHVEMSAELGALESHSIVDKIENDFLENDHINMIIHMDPIGNDDMNLRQTITSIAKKIHPECTIHDLSVTGNEIHFDCLKPAGCTLSDDALITAFDIAIRTIASDYIVHVTIDSSFSPIIN